MSVSQRCNSLLPIILLRKKPKTGTFICNWTWWTEAVFVNLLRSPGIDAHAAQPSGMVRQPYLAYQPDIYKYIYKKSRDTVLLTDYSNFFVLISPRWALIVYFCTHFTHSFHTSRHNKSLMRKQIIKQIYSYLKLHYETTYMNEGAGEFLQTDASSSWEPECHLQYESEN